jgi:hypothetical protein
VASLQIDHDPKKASIPLVEIFVCALFIGLIAWVKALYAHDFGHWLIALVGLS